MQGQLDEWRTTEWQTCLKRTATDIGPTREAAQVVSEGAGGIGPKVTGEEIMGSVPMNLKSRLVPSGSEGTREERSDSPTAGLVGVHLVFDLATGERMSP